MTSLGIPGSSRRPLRLASDRVTTAGKVIDGGMDLTKTVSELMKDVAKTMKDVPFVEGIAGLVFRIIEIRDEMKVKKDRCTELLEKILRRTRVVFEGLLQLSESPSTGDASMASLKHRLEDYNNILVQIHARLAAFAAKGTLSTLWDRDKGPFKECNRLIDDFKDDILLKTAADLIARNPVPSASTPLGLPKSSLPMPSKMFGRDTELDTIIRTLLHSSRIRLAILGPGGMGKTTLALSTIHDTEIKKKYQSRYFVSCEACTTLEAVLSECLDVLGIPPEGRDANFLDAVVAVLKQSNSVLLCLDNFETPWFESSSKRPFEDFLRHLDSLPNIAILITMRGEERPSGLDWTRPLFPPLTRLQASSMLEVLDQAASGQADLEDEDVKQLMIEIDGLPLAATLLGHLLRDGIETPESLRQRWGKENTKMLETDENDRLYSLNRSISLSLSSSVMTKCPAARRILSLLAFLPDGFPSSSQLMDRLDSHLPDDVDLHAAISVLRRVALVYMDQSSHRIRILPPIHRFCLSRLPLEDTTRQAIVEFYLELLDDHQDVSVASNHLVIPPEMHNLEATLFQALNHAPENSAFHAVHTFTWWSMRVGIKSPALVIFARDCLPTQGIQANLWYLEGWLAYHRHDYIQGEAAFQSAVAISQELGDRESEAQVLGQLGELYRLQGQKEHAVNVLRDALKLDPTSRNKAEILQNLGNVQLELNLLDDAEQSLRDALHLHQQVQNGIGEANVLRFLGRLHLRRDQLDEAEMFLQDALHLYRQVQDRLGEANSLWQLGDLHLRRDQLDEAETFLQDALQLHRQVQSRDGEATDLQMLGDLHLRWDQLNEAEKFLQGALQLHQQVQNRLGEANDLKLLADLYRLREEFDTAEQHYQSSLDLYHATGSIWGEGNIYHGLGKLHVKMGRLVDAHEDLQKALELHEKAGVPIGIRMDKELLEKVREQLNSRSSTT